MKAVWVYSYSDRVFQISEVYHGSTQHCAATTGKGVEFVSLKEQLDTNTPQGRFMLTVFAAMAELERETILQRQREGIAAAKRAGKLVHLRDKCFPVCCCIVELIPQPVTLCG